MRLAQNAHVNNSVSFAFHFRNRLKYLNVLKHVRLLTKLLPSRKLSPNIRTCKILNNFHCPNNNWFCLTSLMPGIMNEYLNPFPPTKPQSFRTVKLPPNEMKKKTFLVLDAMHRHPYAYPTTKIKVTGSAPSRKKKKTPKKSKQKASSPQTTSLSW